MAKSLFVKNSFMVSATVALTVATLSGCSLLQGPTPERSTPIKQPKIEQKPAEEIKYKPNGTAKDNLPIFVDTLQKLAASQTPFTGASIKDAFVHAGFDGGRIELTKDHTGLGDEVQEYYVAFRFGDRCLLGQLVKDGRQVIGHEVAAIGPKKDVCIIQKPH